MECSVCGHKFGSLEERRLVNCVHNDMLCPCKGYYYACMHHGKEKPQPAVQVVRDSGQLCDYCDSMCPPGTLSLWESPMDATRLVDGTPAVAAFVICVRCVRLAVEAAVHGEVAPPPVLPRDARNALREAQECYSEGVKLALEIEQALAGVDL